MSATALTVAPPPNLRQTTDFWDLSKRSLAAQRSGRYVPDQKDDPPSVTAARTWPDVAGAVIDTYSEPGDVVFDPMCGTGVTLVEALWRWRSAMGLELEENRGMRAIDNVGLSPSEPAYHSHPGDSPRWVVSLGDARQAADKWDWHKSCWDRQPNLVLIDPPFGATRQDGGRNRFNSPLHNYTGEDRRKSRAQRDQTNLGNLKHDQYLVEMQKVYANCLTVAATGAYMAVILKDYRRLNRRIDLLGDTRRICEAAGWRYYDRATLYLGTASHQQRRNAVANNHLLPITQDLLVFRKG